MNYLTAMSTIRIGALAASLCLGYANVSGADTLITFNSFPGPDNQLGTGDDIAIGPGSPAVFFTDQFARLSGGVGFVVDSAVGGNPSLGYVPSLGAVFRLGGNNLSVTARPDAGPGQFGFGALRYRFVASDDGTTPVTVPQFQFDFIHGIAPGAHNIAGFYDSGGSLLNAILFIDDFANNPRISYANPVGIARVDIFTTFSVATDNLVIPGAVPEASTWAALVAVSLAGLWQARRQVRSA